MSYIPVESSDYPGWYLIPNTPGYLANENGELLILATNRRTIGGLTNNDYPRIRITIDGKHKHTLVHRLICSAFHGPPTVEKYTVNHKNGIKKDNRASNLEWVSQKENNHHAIKNFLNFKRTWRPLKVLDVIQNTQMCFRSKTDLEYFIPGSSLTGIYNAILNRNIYLNRYYIVDIDENIDNVVS